MELLANNNKVNGEDDTSDNGTCQGCPQKENFKRSSYEIPNYHFIVVSFSFKALLIKF